MTYLKSALSIKAWAEEDRPREKLILHGSKNLSKAELLAIIIGSGSRKLTALSLARKILSHYQNDLHKLSKSTVAELKRFDGIATAKAVSILAALELSTRRHFHQKDTITKITSSQDAYNCLVSSMSNLTHEVFKIILLNRQNAVINISQLSSGGITGTIVDPKMIFKKALDNLACGIILCHNHPSGNLKASNADLELTQKIKKAGLLLDINILDHLIISDEGYLSFADEGIL